MKLIVGLGNPGSGYSHNRHNIGFMCVNHLAKELGIHFDKKEGLARTAHGTPDGTPVILARPQTYMNASGEAVKKLMAKYRLEMEDLIVVHDDMDLKLGQMRIRKDGSSAGHKGIESIISRVGGRDFARIRVGVGHPGDKSEAGEADVVDYVLGDFSHEETEVMRKVIPEVSKAVLCLVNEELEAAMNKFNRSNILRPAKPDTTQSV